MNMIDVAKQTNSSDCGTGSGRRLQLKLWYGPIDSTLQSQGHMTIPDGMP